MPSVQAAVVVSALQVVLLKNKVLKEQECNEHVRLRGGAWPRSDKILMKSIGNQCKFYSLRQC